MYQLKTKDQRRFGQKRTLAVIGEVEISKNGIIEVEDLQVAKQISDMDIGFELIMPEEKSNKEQSKSLQTEGSELEVKDLQTEGSELEVKDLQTELSELKVKDLQEICEKAGYDKKDWNYKKKDELVEYILSQSEVQKELNDPEQPEDSF